MGKRNKRKENWRRRNNNKYNYKYQEDSIDEEQRSLEDNIFDDYETKKIKIKYIIEHEGLTCWDEMSNFRRNKALNDLEKEEKHCHTKRKIGKEWRRKRFEKYVDDFDTIYDAILNVNSDDDNNNSNDNDDDNDDDDDDDDESGDGIRVPETV